MSLMDDQVISNRRNSSYTNKQPAKDPKKKKRRTSAMDITESQRACCGFRNNFKKVVAPKNKKGYSQLPSEDVDSSLQRKLSVIEKKNKKKRIQKEEKEYEQ